MDILKYYQYTNVNIQVLWQVTIAYNKDPSPVKLNLGVGAYRTEEGKPYVLRVVREAEQRLINDQYGRYLIHCIFLNI